MINHQFVARQMPGGPSAPPRSPEYLAEDFGSRLLAIEISLYILSTSAILMRFYVRIFMLKIFGWDDWMMVISGAISTTLLGLFITIVHLGLGRHSEAFPAANYPQFLRIVYFYSVLIISSYTFVKLSIGFFLLRISDRTRWRPFLIGMQIFLVCFMIGSVSAIIFQCIPVSAGWDFSQRPPTGTAKCYSLEIFKNVGVSNSAINIATDLLYAIIPIPMVWRLQVNLRTRIGLALILGLGVFASAVSIYKTPLQYNFFKQTDFTGDGSWYYIWQILEMHLGILAACLPTLKPLLAGQFRTFTKGRSTGSAGISARFKSSGYVKHGEGCNQDSFPMKNFGSKSESSQNIRTAHEEVDVVMGKESYMVTTLGGGSMRHHRGESDGSVLRHDQRKSNGLSISRGIVKTTEVNVTR